jgi:hypothetical protein
MGTTRQDCLRVAHALVKLLPGGVAPSAASLVSSGDPEAPRSSVVTVDFRRAARLRLPVEPPPYGARVLAFTRPEAVLLAHPSAAR